MSKMINYGIDLGTTNSLIAKFERGTVQVFKNPNGFKETLPSVVGFRSDRIFIGDQARTYAEKDPKGVGIRFKRKMGTTEVIKLSSGSKTPVELSALVIKELRNFVRSGEAVTAAVVTIPASFDTVQSNATKEAALQAGLNEVVLLQEPIAASLAFANREKKNTFKDGQWIVYDLGGGTFDVALVRIVEGELAVVDHEGDNYLGGSDFDALFVEKLIVPQLLKRGKFTDLLGQMKSETGRYNRLWYRLMHAAEMAKIELSNRTSAEIDLDLINVEDDEGKELDGQIEITRSEFETVIQDLIDRTADMIKRILTRNSLQAQDLQFVLMVGGGTYIPFVRSRIAELLGVHVDTSIDPTNAIAIGAAYYAGTKEFAAPAESTKVSASGLKIKLAYTRSTQDTIEPLTARVEGDTAGLSYRITSEDGAFDSGVRSLTQRISEDLPLREGEYNVFTLSVYDSQNNPIDLDLPAIQIAQGQFNVAGQVLPDDICLVTDDVSLQDTRLKRIFAKNTVLPAKSKDTVEVARTLVHGSAEEVKIIVVEGPAERHSSTNKPIGVLLISGQQISKDLIRGTEIDLTFTMTESRDFTISAFLNGTGQEFSQVFNGLKRQVESKILAREVLDLERKIQDETDDASSRGNDRAAQSLSKLLTEVETLMAECGTLAEDDVTDDRYKLEDQKRKIAQSVFELTSGKRLEAARLAYAEAKREVAVVVAENGNDREKHQLREIFAREETFLNASHPERLEVAISELEAIRARIFFRMPGFLQGMLEHLVENRASMNDQLQANQLIDAARRASGAEDWDDLRQINGRLWNLMPSDIKETDDMRLYTGIV